MATVKTKRKPSAKLLRKILEKGNIIGSGCYRTVYGTTYGKWVVKVNDTSYVNARTGTNRHEYQAYLSVMNAISVLPEGVKIPEMYYIDDFIVAERVRGKHPTNYCDTSGYHGEYGSNPCPGKDKCWAEKLKGVQIRDLHAGNVMITKDGTIYIVDIGHGSNY